MKHCVDRRASRYILCLTSGCKLHRVRTDHQVRYNARASWLEIEDQISAYEPVGTSETICRESRSTRRFELDVFHIIIAPEYQTHTPLGILRTRHATTASGAHLCISITHKRPAQ